MIPPSPPVVSADLAEAALACTALVRARQLAAWVGPGKELTSSGVPRPAAAAEACGVLGIHLPRARLRSALDVDEFMRAWVVTVEAGLVMTDRRRAWAVPGAVDAAVPESVLDTWVKTAAANLGIPDEPCAGCLIVLHELREAGRPLSLEDLAGALTAATAEPAAGERCADCGEVHGPADLLTISTLLGGMEPDVQDDREHAEAAVEGLAAFGAATDGEAVELTPLGSMLADAVFEGCAPAPDAGAGSVVSVLKELSPAVASVMAEPWLAARSPDAAVAELLAYGESADGSQRVVALSLAEGVGPAAAAAWREWADRPGFGAYARQWLADHGEPAAARPEDEAWLSVDALSAMLDDLGDLLPPFVLAAAFREQLGGDAAEAVTMLRGSGHPAAGELVARLTGRDAVITPTRRAGAKRPRGAPDGAGRVCRLRISLRGVSKPPVWRRVVVAAGLTLAELHDVIMLSMGWDDGHLHVFSTGSREYGPAGLDLGFADESRADLAEMLSAPGDTLLYTYDFGDGWEHEVRLEETRPASPGEVYPSCVAGKGACPPEDCGGPWGYAELKEILADPRHEEHEDRLDWLGLPSGGQFDAAAFSLDEVNSRLGRLSRRG